MKKLFNNSTKGNETTSKSKRKFLKTFSFTSLALLMGAAGVFAFAPLGTSPSVASANEIETTTASGLGLDPKNDPVVYTTESGLKIKQSKGKIENTITTTTNTNYSYTQDLSGYFYITMGKFTGTIYNSNNLTSTYSVSNQEINWLIIGRGAGFEFSDSTPAGNSVNNDRAKQEIAIMENYMPISMNTIPYHSDIPDNCFLMLSEKLLGQSPFNSTATHDVLYEGFTGCTIIQNSGCYGNRYRYYGNVHTRETGSQSWTLSNNKGGDLYKYINNLFSKNSSTGAIEGENKINFSQAQANLIVPQQLYTYYSNGEGYNYAETPSTDGGTYYTMFPLAYRAAHSSTKQNFCIEDYLKTTSTQVACLIGSTKSFHWWLRSGTASHSSLVMHVRPDSAIVGYNSSDFLGVRPAFVIKGV